MREVKFRIWMKNENRMLKIDFINQFSKKCDILSENSGICLLEDIELMHYTGFNDKNGVEIYEGDIVEFNACKASGCRLNKARLGVVGFKFGKMIIEPADIKSSCRFVDDFSDCVVVGNIYENKDILAKAKR